MGFLSDLKPEPDGQGIHKDAPFGRIPWLVTPMRKDGRKKAHKQKPMARFFHHKLVDAFLGFQLGDFCSKECLKSIGLLRRKRNLFFNAHLGAWSRIMGGLDA